MSDFLESAKNFMNTTVSRTSWEAQKQLRVRGKQGELNKLFEQRKQLLDEMGTVAMTLYQQGRLSDAQLSRLCASIMELDQDARTRETQLQELKNETYPADQFTPAPTTNYTPPAASSQPVQPTQPVQPYQPAQPTTNTTSSANTNVNTQQGQPCPNCGQPVRANSLYCRNCGAKLR
jgi:hypothetical protein